MAIPKLFAIPLCAASAFALCAPAIAAPRSQKVSHDDLDLSTGQGQDRLKSRIRQAVKRVCSTPNVVSIPERIAHKRCVSDAMARAMPKAEQSIAAYINDRQIASLATDGATIKN